LGAIRASTAAILIVIFFTAPSIARAQTELAVGKIEEGAVAAGKTTTYTLSVHSGDFLNLRLDPHDVEITVVALKPNGEKERATKIGPEADTFAFIAQADGRYKLELSIDDKTKSTTFALTLKKSVPLADRLAAPKPRSESPRINALRAAIEPNNQSAIRAFWQEIQKSGTPLIERPPADDDKEQKEMLVTFLWKGTAATKNVLIVWFPFTMQSPADYRLEQIPNSDIWYRTLKVDARKRFIYRLAPNAPNFRTADDQEDLFPTIFAGSQVDPLNPNHWAADPSDPDVPEHQGFSAVDMPNAPPQPWLAPRKGVVEGKIERHQFASAMLKNEREVAVYLPPKYAKLSGPYPLLVVFDENAYLKNEKETARVPTETILDNLIAEKRIPPMVALFVDNGPGNARSRELPCNSQFADFLNFELMPWLRRLYSVTSDPRQVVVAGSSYGGLASTWAAFRHPETFGNVLSQSGSYWWTPPKANDEFDRESEPSWVAKQFIASPKLPIRFYMDAGSDEIDLSGKGSSILVPNRHLRDVLLAKGYEVHYQEFVGGHDYLSWRGTIADGLILLMGGATDNARPSEPQHEAASQH
jgi:enterochelin esterase-like enzyme